jgi:hypothetical protein
VTCIHKIPAHPQSRMRCGKVDTIVLLFPLASATRTNERFQRPGTLTRYLRVIASLMQSTECLLTSLQAIKAKRTNLAG